MLQTYASPDEGPSFLQFWNHSSAWHRCLSLSWESQESGHKEWFFLSWAISTLYPVEEESNPDLEGRRGQRTELEGGFGWTGYAEVLPQVTWVTVSQILIARWTTHLEMYILVVANVT